MNSHSGDTIRKRVLGLALGTAALFVAGPAAAALMTQNYNVDFSSPTQSFWGPGQGSADAGTDFFIFGNTTFGMRFQAGASSGTVRSSYNGAVSVGYDDVAAPGNVSLNLQYTGDTNGGSFTTNFGASVDVTAYFPVIGDVSVFEQGYSLSTSRTYTPSPPDSRSDSDSFTPLPVAIGPSLPVLGSAQAGIDFDIVQNATHTIGQLTGTARATHQVSGEVRTAGFSLGASDDIVLNLDAPGIWDIELTSLALGNTFSTDIDLALVAFAQFILGFNCGDAGDDDDNGIGCVGDGRLDNTLTNFDLFSNTPFALNLTSSNVLSSFQITVETPDVVEPPVVGDVPAPAGLALFGLGLLGLGIGRRRHA